MGLVKTAVAGVGLGLLTMYFFDPNRGRTRRALVRDKTTSMWHMKLNAERTMLKDVRNRLSGLLHRTKRRFERETPDDRTLRERVLSRIGHVVSHPGALEVDAYAGTVLIRGPILTSEKPDLMRALWEVEGVEAIEHKLEEYDSADHVPALQGEQHHDQAGSLPTPAAALAVSIAGGLLAMYGLSRRGALGTGLGVAGLGLIAKSVSDVRLNETPMMRIAE